MDAYNAFNLHILQLKFQLIKWNLPSSYKKTHIATSTHKSKGKRILVVPNYDWREIYSHNMDLPKFTVPPEKFPIGLITKDNKLINLNIDYSRGKYECGVCMKARGMGVDELMEGLEKTTMNGFLEMCEEADNIIFS